MNRKKQPPKTRSCQKLEKTIFIEKNIRQYQSNTKNNIHNIYPRAKEKQTILSEYFPTLSSVDQDNSCFFIVFSGHVLKVLLLETVALSPKTYLSII